MSKMNTEGVPDTSKARGDLGNNDQRVVLCTGVHREAHCRRYLVNFLVMLIGIGTFVTVNGVAAEIPLLVKTAPEGSRLSSNLVLALMLAYTAPAIYALSNKSAAASQRVKYEITLISSALALATVVMGLFAFFHGVTISINSVDHSLVMILLLFILASVAASDNILLLPYLQNIKEVNLVSFFIGEHLSGLIPSIVALIQGVGDDPLCPSEGESNSTEFSVPRTISEPRFSSRSYFLFLSGLLAVATCSSWLLECLRVQTPREENTASHHNHISTEEDNSSKKLLDDESAEQTLEIEMINLASHTLTDSVAVSGSEKRNGNTTRLCVLMWLLCFTSNGFLNAMEAFSSRPYGNTAFNLAANLSRLFGTATCIVSFWLPTISTRGITVVMGIVLAVTSYVTWLALCSPTPPLRNTTYGIYLLVIIWVILMSLVAYTKLTISTIVWRKQSDRDIYRLGFANLTGSFCSGSVTFYVVNFTTLFTPYAPCEPYIQLSSQH